MTPPPPSIGGVSLWFALNTCTVGRYEVVAKAEGAPADTLDTHDMMITCEWANGSS